MNVSYEIVAADLFRRDDFLIFTHERPDGDAVGSALGMRSFLRSCGKHAEVFFPEALPEKYLPLTGEVRHAFSGDELNSFHTVVVLDCAVAARIGCGAIDYAGIGTVFNLDHHALNDVNGNCNLVDVDAAACSEICARLAMLSGCPVKAEAAMFWLLGILTDTGAFRFSNTHGHVLRVAADLLDAGADYERLINAIYFSKPRNQQAFEADMAANYVVTGCGGKFVYAALPEALFEKYHFSMRDGEGLIDILREISGSLIAALIYRKDGMYKISLRSKDANVPVLGIARELGGGGHLMAAGITVQGESLEAVAEMLAGKVCKLLKMEH